jgi:hypothetical protein
MNHSSPWPRMTCAAVALALIVLTAGCAPSAATSDPTASGNARGESKPAATPIKEVAIEPEVVPPGRYEMGFGPAVPNSPVADVTVPEGFHVFGDEGAVLWNSDSTRGLTFGTVWQVARDPCKAVLDQDQFYDPGASVKDLAAALLGQKYRVGPEPRPVELAGYKGLYLELRFAKGFKIGKCAGAEGPTYLAWHSRSSDRSQYSDASIDRIWILDVKGERLIVNTTHTAPGGDPVLDKMVKTLTIHPRR